MPRLITAVLALCATAAPAQETEADPLDAISRIEAYACVAEGEARLFTFRREPGGLVALGDIRGAQVFEADGFLTFIKGAMVLQIGPTDSVAVIEGVVTPVVCTSATDALTAALLDMVGDPAGAAPALEQGAATTHKVKWLRALLASAQAQLSEEEAASAERRREVAALNAQVAELRAQVAGLQELLDLAEAADAAADVQIEALGADLNAALARLEQERRARIEAEEGAATTP